MADYGIQNVFVRLVKIFVSQWLKQMVFPKRVISIMDLLL